MKSTASPARSPSPGGSSSPSIQGKDAKIEDGKLFYEKRWFRPFQYVTVDWKDGPSYEAVISAIGSEAIWVRKVWDNAKVCMYVTRLVKDGDGEDRRYGLYNDEYQFDPGGANSFFSCGKVMQINGQGECTMEQVEETHGHRQGQKQLKDEPRHLTININI